MGNINHIKTKKTIYKGGKNNDATYDNEEEAAMGQFICFRFHFTELNIEEKTNSKEEFFNYLKIIVFLFLQHF